MIPRAITSPPTTRTSSATFHQYEIPIIRPKPTSQIPSPPPPSSSHHETLFIDERKPTLFPRSLRIERELPPPLPPPPPAPIRSKITREYVTTPPHSIKKQPVHNIYQEIDSTSTDDDQYPTRNADLQFIRGAIERVFHFNGESTTDTTSESDTFYEKVDNNDYVNQRKTKSSTQYPAIDAIQRFYNHKTLSDFSNQQQQQHPNEQITNLDDVTISNSSTSKKSSVQSPPIIQRKIHHSKKSTENERASSEEIDDTLNDIEDVDYRDDKSKHQSNENSPSYSSDKQSKKIQTSQETQTIERVCNSIENSKEMSFLILESFNCSTN